MTIQHNPPLSLAKLNIRFELNDKQKAAFAAATWLMDPSTRGGGRTTLLALVAIQHALRTAGSKVALLDHADGRQGQDALARTVESLLHSFGLREFATFQSNAFYISGPAPDTEAYARFAERKRAVLSIGKDPC